MRTFHPARPGRAIYAGFSATLAMTLFLYLAPLLRLPVLDYAGWLGAALFGWTGLPETARWWLGMAAHFVNGALLFPLFYAYFAYGVLPGSPTTRGFLFAMGLWFLAEALVSPLLGAGFFSSATPLPGHVLFTNLASHALYGVVVGALASRQAVVLADDRRHSLAPSTVG